tara:strand:+ start:159 stop:446 length:288 start_codon:yes stop_codon:yes gene_type:complete
MSKGYWVVKANIEDPEEYSKYIEKATLAVDSFNGNFLIRGGNQIDKENKGFQRTVVVEFSSYKKALDCYESMEYQTALNYVEKSANRIFTVVEGI